MSADLLAEINDLIQRAGSRATLLGERDHDPAGRMRLEYLLGQARRAVADLQTPGRRSPSGGPVDSSRLRGEVRPGSRAASLPGAGFDLPPIPTVPSFDNGPMPWPGRPFPDYEVPEVEVGAASYGAFPRASTEGWPPRIPGSPPGPPPQPDPRPQSRERLAESLTRRAD